MNTKERSEAIQARAMELVRLWPDGRIANKNEAIASLITELGCTKGTAWKHVARAARRKRHPSYCPPQWGGKRDGAGRPYNHVIDVANGRCIVSRRVDGQWGLLEYSAAVNWKELEPEAAQVIGAIQLAGQYPCPTYLVEQAIWDSEEDGDETG
jgi:hypothetical protein